MTARTTLDEYEIARPKVFEFRRVERTHECHHVLYAFSIMLVGSRPSMIGSMNVRAGQTRIRCVGDKDRVRDTAGVSDTEFRAELERRPDRQSAHRPL